MIDRLIEQSEYFIKSSQNDIDKVKVARRALLRFINTNTPLVLSMQGNNDFIDISLDGDVVLTVVNLNTTPITPDLDTVALSQTGKLNAALDYRPFMLSGPCPTSVLWSGSGELGLTEEDAGKAFKYWLKFIFCLEVDESTGLLKGI